MNSWLNTFVEIVFSVSLFFNAVFFIPQAIRIFKMKRAEEVSLITFAGFNIMQLFTAWHGYIVKDYTLMIGFILSFITCGMVTILILIYGKNGNAKKSRI